MSVQYDWVAHQTGADVTPSTVSGLISVMSVGKTEIGLFNPRDFHAKFPWMIFSTERPKQSVIKRFSGVFSFFFYSSLCWND